MSVDLEAIDVTKIAITQRAATHVPVTMATDSALMDTLAAVNLIEYDTDLQKLGFGTILQIFYLIIVTFKPISNFMYFFYVILFMLKLSVLN